MEGPMAYRATYGTNLKFVHFPRINDGSPQLKRESTATTSRNYHRGFLGHFPFLRLKRQERPILIKDSPEVPLKKAPLKSIIQRHSILKMESSVEASPYMWPHDGSLDPKTTALVIIDMQKDCEFPFPLLGAVQEGGSPLKPHFSA